jgi:tRNA pseudouridine38-40 synthase
MLDEFPGDPASQGPEAQVPRANPGARLRNLKLTLAYDGTDFAGWQVQPGRATIQGFVASAIGRLTGENVLPQGSGRTDAGVHALAQVATLATRSPIPVENFAKVLNDTLPASIRVLSAEEVAPEFHARKSARAKTYEYRMDRRRICSPFAARYVWHYPFPLDEAAMAEAAGVVEGEHDFTSFAAVDPEKSSGEEGREPPRTNIRRIDSSLWQRRGDEFVYTVRGSGFLHHMVRNLVGTFVLVGRGTVDCQALRHILALRNRSAAGATAPASGLFLINVEY